MRENFDLSKISWFGVGGRAEFFYKPKTFDDLKSVLSKNNANITVLGNCSNLLIRDGGIGGVVIKLSPAFANLKLINENTVEVGAAFLDKNFAMEMAKYELSGFEFLSTIPGNIGGGIKMNCGCFGGEISDILVRVIGLDFKGNILEIDAKDLNFSYRSTSIPEDFIITSAVFKGTKSSKKKILKKCQENQNERNETQPIGGKTCGSTFKNPKGMKAWELIVAAGLKNLKIGGASFSEKHANFIMNDGSATAKDIETLGEIVIDKIYNQFSIKLEWEIRKIGEC